MSLTLALAARERHRASARLLERALLALVLLCLLESFVDAFGRAVAGPDPPPQRPFQVSLPGATGPPPPLVVDVARDPPWRLVYLPGIGPSRAAAIVRDRAARGPPRVLDDLLRVPGIGPQRLALLKTARDVRVIVGDAAAGVPP